MTALVATEDRAPNSQLRIIGPFVEQLFELAGLVERAVPKQPNLRRNRPYIREDVAGDNCRSVHISHVIPRELRQLVDRGWVDRFERLIEQQHARAVKDGRDELHLL